MLHLKGILTFDQQFRLVEICRLIAKVAPFITPVMPSGHSFNCQQTSCGIAGWLADKQGYRYSTTQQNGEKFPAMPKELADLAIHLASRVGEVDYKPETCLINYYPPNSKSKLGLHQDNTEANLKPCIISICLGDDCEFLLGGTRRTDPVETIALRSGDILILHGDSRLAYHGVKRLIPNTGSKGLLKNGGRLNLTFRQIY